MAEFDDVKVCVTCELDQELGGPHLVRIDPAGSKTPALVPSSDQDNLLLDGIEAFQDPRWHGPSIIFLVFVKDVSTSDGFFRFDAEPSKKLAKQGLFACYGCLTRSEYFEMEMGHPGIVPPNLNLELHAFAQSPYLEGSCPLLLSDIILQPIGMKSVAKCAG